MSNIENGHPDAYLELLKRCLTASIYEESSWEVVAPGKRNRIKRWIIKTLGERSYLLVKRLDFDKRTREEGLDWPLIGYTMIGQKRLDNIQHCVEDALARSVPGDLIETGVWRGGATIFMRALLKLHGIKDRCVWVADSFEGLPKPNTALYGAKAGADLSDRSILKVSVDVVKANFARFGLLDDQVKFLKGWFRDTLPNAPIKQLAVLRLDGDLYESTMDALKALYPRLSPGGYVIVDDYNSWPSCKAAVDDFRRERGVTSELSVIDSSGVFWQAAQG